MSYQKSELYFLFALLAGVSVIAFFIFQPFLSALILAVIFATVFAPIHKRISTLVRGTRGLSALLATMFVLIVTVVPVTILSTLIFNQATELYSSMVSGGGVSGLSLASETVMHKLGINFLPVDSVDLGRYMKQGLGFLVQNLGTIFSNIAKIMVDIFILLLALYYLFRDGDKLKKAVLVLSPLHDTHDETIFHKLELAINSVVRGSISVALVQGVLTAIGLTIFGVPNSVLWGSVAAVTALIPGVGTALVLIPSVIFLFFAGSAVSAVGLLVWGIIAVGLVDNVLGPKLVGRGVKLHSFLVLLSMLGGLSLFGPLGFLFGPLVLSLLFAFIEIYSIIRGERNK